MDRKTWFITRPTRDALTSHAELATAMRDVAEGQKWFGNTELQQALEETLSELGVKAPGTSTYGSAGRTWAALARTFGYWYPDAEGRVVITPVAEAIIDGDRAPEHICKQILCYQLPNGYVKSGDFRPPYEPGFKILPFRFLLRLLLDPALNHRLHRDEVALFVLPVKTEDQYDEVKTLINLYRQKQLEDGLDLATRAELLEEYRERFDHRERADSGKVSYLAYARDSANSHLILLQAVNRSWLDRPDGIIRLNPEHVDDARNMLAWYDANYPYDNRIRISAELYARHYGLDLSRRKNNFRTGRGPVMTTARKQEAKIMRLCGEIRRSTTDLSGDELVHRIAQASGFLAEEIRPVLEQHGKLAHTSDAPEQKLIADYLEAADSTGEQEFERLTMALFQKLDLTATQPAIQSGGNVDILVRWDLPDHGPQIGIIECMSGRERRVGIGERDQMATYVQDYARTGNGVSFFGFLVGQGFKGNANFAKIAEKALQMSPTLHSIAGFVMNAPTLLAVVDMYNQELLNSEDLRLIFCSNEIFLTPESVELYLRRVRSQN